MLLSANFSASTQSSWISASESDTQEWSLNAASNYFRNTKIEASSEHKRTFDTVTGEITISSRHTERHAQQVPGRRASWTWGSSTTSLSNTFEGGSNNFTSISMFARYNKKLMRNLRLAGVGLGLPRHRQQRYLQERQRPEQPAYLPAPELAPFGRAEVPPDAGPEPRPHRKHLYFQGHPLVHMDALRDSGQASGKGLCRLCRHNSRRGPRSRRPDPRQERGMGDSGVSVGRYRHEVADEVQGALQLRHQPFSRRQAQRSHGREPQSQ